MDLLSFLKANTGFIAIVTSILAAMIALLSIWLNHLSSVRQKRLEADIQLRLHQGKQEIDRDEAAAEREATSEKTMIIELQNFRSFTLNHIRNAEFSGIDEDEFVEALDAHVLGVQNAYSQTYANCSAAVSRTAHAAKVMCEGISGDIREQYSSGAIDSASVSEKMEHLKELQDTMRDRLLTR